MAIGGFAANVGSGSGRQDIRAHLGKKRAQDLLRKHDILDKAPVTVRAGGEIDAIRAVIAEGEGFTMPVNFAIEFYPPSGLMTDTINPGGLDAKSHILNRSNDVREGGMLWKQAADKGSSKWYRRKPEPSPPGARGGKPELEPPEPTASANNFNSIWNIFNNIIS